MKTEIQIENIFLAFLLIACHTSFANEPLLAINIPASIEMGRMETPSAITKYHAGTDYDENKLTISRYEQSILDLQSTYGVYHSGIGEELLGLGLAFQNQNKHYDAAQAFKRALMISRVNEGLYNLDQLRILELMIESNTAISDWETLDQNYHYLHWVYLRAFGHNHPRLLPVNDRIGRWHLNAYEMKIDETPYWHLLNALKQYASSIEIIEEHHGVTDPRLISPLYGLTLTSYEMALHAVNAPDFEEIYMSTMRFKRTESLLMLNTRNRQEILNRSFIRGKKAMERIIGIISNNSQSPVDSQAIAMTHLGDWFLLFNQKRTALKRYKQAYELLNNNDESNTEDVNQLFSRPKSLPAIQMPLMYKKVKKDKYVVASFDVTETGRPKHIEIVETNPEDENNRRFIRRAKKVIKAGLFRPRFENGQAVATNNFHVRYVFEE